MARISNQKINPNRTKKTAYQKRIFIDTWFGLIRAAITLNKKLIDFFEEVPDKKQEKNNIYRAQVKRIEPGLEAAFLDYGSRREGFLPLKEVGQVVRANGTLGEIKEGDILLVQVTKDGIGSKGSALTTKLSLPGRYLVFLPNHASGGISRSIQRKERGELRKKLGQLKNPKNSSVIIRTVSAKQPLKTLQADLNMLQNTYSLILEDFSKAEKNGLIYQDQDSVVKFLREYYTEDIEKITVNNPDAKKSCEQFFEKYALSGSEKIYLSREGSRLFQKNGIESQISAIRHPFVKLPSGASLVIQKTEALVSIDVNSSKSKNASEFEQMVFAVNQEAAQEIARQIRLRDLGGIIVIDFIDMNSIKHRKEIEDLLKKETKSDKASVTVNPIGPLGTMILARQRMMSQGRHRLLIRCESCRGEGHHLPLQTIAHSILLKIETQLKKRRGPGELIASVKPFVATFLLNQRRSDIQMLENNYQVAIQILPKDLSEDISCKIERIFWEDKKTTSSQIAGELIEIKPKKPSHKRKSKAPESSPTSETETSETTSQKIKTNPPQKTTQHGLEPSAHKKVAKKATQKKVSKKRVKKAAKKAVISITKKKSALKKSENAKKKAE